MAGLLTIQILLSWLSKVHVDRSKERLNRPGVYFSIYERNFVRLRNADARTWNNDIVSTKTLPYIGPYIEILIYFIFDYTARENKIDGA